MDPESAVAAELFLMGVQPVRQSQARRSPLLDQLHASDGKACTLARRTSFTGQHPLMAIPSQAATLNGKAVVVGCWALGVFDPPPDLQNQG